MRPFTYASRMGVNRNHAVGPARIPAWQDPERRASKRQKDLLDILRLAEANPKLKKLPPSEVARKIQE